MLYINAASLGNHESSPAIHRIAASSRSTFGMTHDRKQHNIDQARIVPRHGYYVVEVVYSKKPVQAKVDPAFCVGIDPGVTNLAAIASNRKGFAPRLVNGRPLKARNQWYNKRMKELKINQTKGVVSIKRHAFWNYNSFVA